ncbi:hypothetical protein [Methylobacterium crusticola]|nr:hypothetical protein [Methylobacterium crusticola]
MLLGVALAATPSARADQGAVFCKGGMVFAERPAPDGALAISVLGADERQHIITVVGVARPHKNGWRFRQTSDEEPDERCTLDIVPVAGGFRMHTIEGARCVGFGGYGADRMLYDAVFPASTRVRGVAPLVDGIGHLRDFDCDRKTFSPSRYGAPPGRTP